MPKSRQEPKHPGGQGKVGADMPSGDQEQNRRNITRQAGGAPRSGSSFAARFGRVILQHGVAALPAALYHYQSKLNLYAQHVWFISYILAHRWDEDLPYPSLGNMARCTGMSKRQLQRYSDELQRMGYLQVYERVSTDRGQQSNAYDFANLFADLEHWIVQERPRPNPIRAAGELPAYVEAAERDNSFVARYGRVIVSYGVTVVPRALFTHQHSLSLEPQQVWFVAYIMSYQWDTALPYPSLIRMAQQTGYTPAYLHRIKNSLVNQSYLKLYRRTNSSGGQDSNAYDFSGLLDTIRDLLQPEQTAHNLSVPGDEEAQESALRAGEDIHQPLPRRGSRAVQARKDRQSTKEAQVPISRAQHSASSTPDAPASKSYRRPRDTQYIAPSDNQYSGADDVQYVGVRDMQYTEGNDIQYIGGHDAELSEVIYQQSRPQATRSIRRPVTAHSQDVETKESETIKERNDSNRSTLNDNFGEENIERAHITKRGTKQQSPNDTSTSQSRNTAAEGQSRGRTTQSYSHYIAQVTTDFSGELGDVPHTVANVSQALRLWQGSSLGEEQFVSLMYEAKQRTRLGQHLNGSSGVANRAAYFFRCLRELLQSS